MTITASATGRKPYVNPKVPTFAIDRRLGRIHVGTSLEDVENMIRASICNALEHDQAAMWTPQIQEQTVRYAIWRHLKNREDYAWVMGSH